MGLLDSNNNNNMNNNKILITITIIGIHINIINIVDFYLNHDIELELLLILQ